MSIQDKLMDIIKQIQDLYPHLDRLMINNLENPDSIVITSESRIDEIAEELGFDPEIIEEITEQELDDIDAHIDLMELKKDDDNGGGFIQ